MHAVAAAGSGLVNHEWRATAVRRWGVVPAGPRAARPPLGQSAQQDAPLSSARLGGAPL